MWKIIFISNFILCGLTKVFADFFLLRNSDHVPMIRGMLSIGFWRYSKVEDCLDPSRLKTFRKIYKTAQILLLLLFLQVVVAVVVILYKVSN